MDGSSASFRVNRCEFSGYVCVDSWSELADHMQPNAKLKKFLRFDDKLCTIKISHFLPLSALP